MISGKNLLDFRRTRSLLFPRLSRVHVSWIPVFPLFASGPGVLQYEAIFTAFREPERSRLGGHSLCLGGPASERCDGSGKAAMGQVTIM